MSFNGQQNEYTGTRHHCVTIRISPSNTDLHLSVFLPKMSLCVYGLLADEFYLSKKKPNRNLTKISMTLHLMILIYI